MYVVGRAGSLRRNIETVGFVPFTAQGMTSGVDTPPPVQWCRCHYRTTAAVAVWMVLDSASVTQNFPSRGRARAAKRRIARDTQLSVTDPKVLKIKKITRTIDYGSCWKIKPLHRYSLTAIFTRTVTIRFFFAVKFWHFMIRVFDLQLRWVRFWLVFLQFIFLSLYSSGFI